MPVNSGVIERLIGDLCFKADKIQTELGFEPKVQLNEGIQTTTEWFLQGYPPTPMA